MLDFRLGIYSNCVFFVPGIFILSLLKMSEKRASVWVKGPRFFMNDMLSTRL